MWDWTKRDPQSNKDALNDQHPVSDDFVSYAAHLTQAAAALQEGHEHAKEEPQTPEGIPVTPVPDVLHIVIVNEPEPEASAPVVESTLTSAPETDVPPITDDLDASADEGIPTSPFPNPTRPMRRRVLWIGIGVSAVLALWAVLLLLDPLLLAAPITVTIIPSSQTITTTMQVTLSTGLHPATGSLAGRALPMLSLSETATVPTTGIGHQPAEPGRGMVTFYNAAPSVQTIPVGTLLTGKDGTEVVTATDAVIPAGQLSTNGQVTVPAQTVNVGPSGNIGAGDLYGACCREGVYVQNLSAFRGGQNARTYPMVRAQDIAKVEGILHPQLIASLKAAFLTDLAPGESLVTPFACRETVDESAGIGDEATSLTLMLTDTCTAVAYHTQELATLVTQQLMARAQQQVGQGSTLMGMITPQMLDALSVSGKPTMQRLTVRGTGTWAYQFSAQQIEQMAKVIAGKSAAQATSILLQTPGVSQVNVGTGGTLPADPSRIHVLVIEQGS